MSGNSLVCNNGREGYTSNESSSGVDYSTSVLCFPNSHKQGKVSKCYRLVGMRVRPWDLDSVCEAFWHPDDIDSCSPFTHHGGPV